MNFRIEMLLLKVIIEKIGLEISQEVRHPVRNQLHYDRKRKAALTSDKAIL